MHMRGRHSPYTQCPARYFYKHCDATVMVVTHANRPHMPTHAHTCPHMPTHAHTCPHMPTYAHTCPHMPTHMPKYKYICICIYPHTCTCLHATCHMPHAYISYILHMHIYILHITYAYAYEKMHMPHTHATCHMHMHMPTYAYAYVCIHICICICPHTCGRRAASSSAWLSGYPAHWASSHPRAIHRAPSASTHVYPEEVRTRAPSLVRVRANPNHTGTHTYTVAVLPDASASTLRFARPLATMSLDQGDDDAQLGPADRHITFELPAPSGR